jgi:hypothetical protein
VLFELPRRRGLFAFLGALRGAIDTSVGARAVLLVGFGSTAKVLTFPYGNPGSGEGTGDLATGSESLFSVEGWLSDVEIDTAPSCPPLVVSITLLAQRQTPADNVLAQITLLDIVAASYDGGGRQPLDIEE